MRWIRGIEQVLHLRDAGLEALFLRAAFAEPFVLLRVPPDIHGGLRLSIYQQAGVIFASRAYAFKLNARQQECLIASLPKQAFHGLQVIRTGAIVVAQAIALVAGVLGGA